MNLRITQAREYANKGSTLALKPRADVTRSPKQDYQWDQWKGFMSSKNLFKKKGSHQKGPIAWRVIRQSDDGNSQWSITVCVKSHLPLQYRTSVFTILSHLQPWAVLTEPENFFIIWTEIVPDGFPLRVTLSFAKDFWRGLHDLLWVDCNLLCNTSPS